MNTTDRSPRLSAGFVARSCPASAFTLIEIVAAIVIIGLLVSLAVPKINSLMKEAKIRTCIEQMKALEGVINHHFLRHREYPSSLAEAGAVAVIDPWGNNFRYLKIQGAGQDVTGQTRKNQFQVPLNDDYDLYSMGPDGKSASPLTASHSQDDIVRANNGQFLDVASKY